MIKDESLGYVLDGRYWHYLGNSINWIKEVKGRNGERAKVTTSGCFRWDDNQLSAEVTIADVDFKNPINYFNGETMKHNLTIKYKVDDEEEQELNFRVKYEAWLYHDPDKNENINDVTECIEYFTLEGGEAIWFSPDDDDGPWNDFYSCYYKVGKHISTEDKYDGTSFRLELEPYFVIDSEQEIDVFEAFDFDILKIVKATVYENEPNPPIGIPGEGNWPGIVFETEGPHRLSANDRVIIRGCNPKGLNTDAAKHGVSRRGIEVIEENKFKIIDQYVSDLINDNSIQDGQEFEQHDDNAVAVLDTKEFEILSESLAGLVDYNSLIDKVKERYGDVEIFKREMATVGSRGQLVAWINEQLQILHFQYSSDPSYFDIDTYKGMISLKRYFKSINEELYNGLDIGQNCNRDTSGLKGIEKEYCESASEPCGCYTLGCMVFQEATDNRLEKHIIRSTDTEWLSGKEYIKFTTDDPHGLVIHDNVIIERCKLGLFNLRTKRGILVGTDREFYVELNEYKEKDHMELTQRSYAPDARVSLSQLLPSKNWEKLKLLNNSEQTTFIEKFWLNTPSSIASGSKLYLPVQGLNETIKVKKGWGAALRIYLVDSNKNKLNAETQWGQYGDNVDYLLGSRDSLTFRFAQDTGSVSILFDKKTSSSIIGNSHSKPGLAATYLVIEILTVRSTYGEWLGYGVVLPSDFGRVNGVAAVDKFIQEMNKKLGLTGISFKAGASIKLAAVLEILKVFEVKFGLIADFSISLTSAGEVIALDIGVFGSLGVDLGNIGLDGNSAQVEIADLQRYVIEGGGMMTLLLFSLINPHLGTLAYAFNSKELALIKKFTKERIKQETAKVDISIAGVSYETEKITKTHVGLNKTSYESSYGFGFDVPIGDFESAGASAKTTLEKDNDTLKTQNLWFLTKKKDDDTSPLGYKLPRSYLLVLALSSGAFIAQDAISTIRDLNDKDESQLRIELNNYQGEPDNKFEKYSKIANQYVPNGAEFFQIVAMLRVLNLSPADLNKLLEFYNLVKDDWRNVLKLGKKLKDVKKSFNDLGDFVKSGTSKNSMKHKLGLGFTQTLTNPNLVAQAQNEIETLEAILNDKNESLDNKCLSILNHQKNSTLPISSRDITLLGSVEKVFELKTPRVPLFTGVRIGAELEFKIYGEVEINLLSLLGMESYNIDTMEKMIDYTKDTLGSQ